MHVSHLTDGAEVYREVSYLETDTRALQSDVDYLNGWGSYYKVQYRKCETMRKTFLGLKQVQ